MSQSLGWAGGVLGCIATAIVSTASAEEFDPQSRWTGLYGGFQVSAAYLDSSYFREVVLAPVTNASFDFTDAGVAFGGFVGANYQFQSLVAGIEASFFDLDLKNETSDASGGMGNVEVSDLFLVAARLGFASGKYLVYAKLGYANAETEITGVNNFNTHTDASKGREDGYVLGAGFDYALFHNVLVGIDYTFVSIDGDRSNTRPLGSPFGFQTNQRDIEADIHLLNIRSGVKF